ncbi:MAG: site-specific integrase [Spirochaetes bacterium]|nr:site-specific integrase [Spirochaetota bacterium]
MRQGKPYNLFRRARKAGKPVYYCRFRKPGGGWTTAESTGETTKGAAEAWAVERLQAAGVFETKKKITLRTYSRGFFDWSARWAEGKRATGRRLSPPQCKTYQAFMARYILPALGDRDLRDIEKRHLEDLRNGLFREGMGASTINKIMGAVKILMETAYDDGIIKGIPKAERVSLRGAKRRGAFTPLEIRELFSPRAKWTDERARVCCLLAATTGMRRGELMALAAADIDFTRNVIGITKVWCERERKGKAGTKTSDAGRYAVAPRTVMDEIARLLAANPWGTTGGALLFYSPMRADKPMEGRALTKCFYRALVSIGIPEKERERRALTFHSLRHSYNSLMIGAKIPAEKLRKIVGHSTMEMTENYMHIFDPSDYGDMVQAVERVFDLGTSGAGEGPRH